MIVDADAVTANAAAIAIWLMSRACFGRPLFGMGVSVTGGIIWSSCVMCGNLCGCVESTSFAEMWSVLCWMAGTSSGVFCRVCLQCVHIVFIRFCLAMGSRACMMAGLLVTL